MAINLLDFDAAGLTGLFAEHGERAFRARQVLRWLHRCGQADFADMTDLARSLREKLSTLAIISPPAIVADRLGEDGTRKFLFAVGGGNAVEAVFIPEVERGTLCISTQAGCALDCSFCATGKQGFNRNLSVGEIVGQLWQVRHALGAYSGREAAGERVISNVVLMGMGEPLANQDNVIVALRLLLDDNAYGLSRRRVTVSTSGLVPAIDRLREKVFYLHMSHLTCWSVSFWRMWRRTRAVGSHCVVRTLIASDRTKECAVSQPRDIGGP